LRALTIASPAAALAHCEIQARGARAIAERDVNKRHAAGRPADDFRGQARIRLDCHLLDALSDRNAAD
jgi:hypothetical protein